MAEFVILAIEGDPETNWIKLFSAAPPAALPAGKRLRVEQSEWSLISSVFVDGDGVCHATLAPSPEPIDRSQKFCREVVPDFLLVRQYVRGLHGQEWLRTLYAFMIAGIPSVNSLESVFHSAERASSIAELRRIQRLLGGPVEFPLVPLAYYPNTGGSVQLPRSQLSAISPQRPLVAKVGSACAGLGKMKFEDPRQFEDFSGTLALCREYVTVEPFVPNVVCDVRIQAIGEHLRAYCRTALPGGSWKRNVGESEVTDLVVPAQLRRWTEAVRHQMWHGLEIFAIDAVQDTQGRLHILEVNDIAGLAPQHKDEDLQRIRDVVLQRVCELVSRSKP